MAVFSFIATPGMLTKNNVRLRCCALPIRARLKAVELLCKMYGDFLERVVIKEEPVKMPVINFVYTDDDE